MRYSNIARLLWTLSFSTSSLAFKRSLYDSVIEIRNYILKIVKIQMSRQFGKMCRFSLRFHEKNDKNQNDEKNRQKTELKDCDLTRKLEKN